MEEHITPILSESSFIVECGNNNEVPSLISRPRLEVPRILQSDPLIKK